MREQSFRRKPSLSAFMMATKLTSGRSRPSRNRLTPTTTSSLSLCSARSTSVRCGVVSSQCIYVALTPFSVSHLAKSSASRLEIATTSAFWPLLETLRMAPSNDWSCPCVLRTSTTGSSTYVGRMVISTTLPPLLKSSCPAISAGGPILVLALRSSSKVPGVADTKMPCGTCFQNSGALRGRLSSALGRRKPYSTSVFLRLRSPAYMACSCGSDTCDSSAMSSQSFKSTVLSPLPPLSGSEK
mmetsp:Transcript_78868/g.136760  ORF Transcript_78868/g.136760 Transcript_78868/m.136760 type:complete len:242 (-) Transcript_78868:1043-1768(-)